MKRFPVIKRASGITFIMLLLLAFGCGKEYSFEASRSQKSSGTWEFTEGSSNFQGPLDSVYIVKSSSINELHLKGHHATSGEAFHMILYADSFKTGIYKTSAFQAAFDYGSQPTYTYSADQTTGEFVVNIVSANGALITGDFAGEVLKNGSDTAMITKGKFRAMLKPATDLPGSQGTLGNEDGNCMPVVIDGNYMQGTDLDASNTVQVQVNVTEPGTYQVFTDPVNGVIFAGTGNFTSRGQQTVVLTGSGTPAFGGEQFFVVHYGNSSCGFSISFATTGQPTNDYYVTTPGSYWEYTQNGQVSYYKVTPDNTQFNGNTFTIIGQVQDPNDGNYTPATTVRKQAGSYYKVLNYAQYTNSSEPKYIETIFLKDNISKGASWSSPDFSDTIAGVKVTFHLKYTITEKAVPVSLGQFPFPDVIKVSSELYSGGTPTGIIEEHWYARNVGLVYYKDWNGNVAQITDYFVLP